MQGAESLNRMRPGPRRAPSFRQPGALADRVRRVIAFEPDRVWSQTQVAHVLRMKRCDLENCLSNMVVSGDLVELVEGFAAPTPEMLARARAQAEAEPARAMGLETTGPAWAAHFVVRRAHLLRQEGHIAGAIDLLERATGRARTNRIRANFSALAALFADCLGPYRDIARAEALRVAAANGWDGEGQP